MYNRYIPGTGGYTRIAVEESEPARQRGGAHTGTQQRERQPHQGGGGRSHSDVFKQLGGPLNFFAGEDKNAGIAGILKSLHLEELDSGDILLLLIMLFLVLEGDNLELVITLGLLLLFGLVDGKTDDQKE